MAGIVPFLLHLIFPVRCPLCGRAGSCGCVECIKEVLSPNFSLCIKCLGPYPCEEHSSSFPHYWGARHEGMARKLVHLLKYENNGALGVSMGMALASYVTGMSADALVPIPLHIGSPRLFNQSRKIAQGLSLKLDIPMRDCLAWNVEVAPRASKGSARSKLPENSFKVTGSLGGIKTAIICDDVCTTGATIQKAASSLAKIGIEVVGSISFTVGKGPKL